MSEEDLRRSLEEVERRLRQSPAAKPPPDRAAAEAEQTRKLGFLKQLDEIERQLRRKSSKE